MKAAEAVSTVVATTNVAVTMAAVETAATTMTVVADAALMGWFVGATRRN